MARINRRNSCPKVEYVNFQQQDKTCSPKFVKNVKGRTANQELLLEAIDTSPLTLAIGPAGTGKTYLAVVKAVEALSSRRVSKIIISRPVVAAEEELGFLPGDLNQKMDPWMRPIFDALNERMGAKQVRDAIRNGEIEIAPLAYMRGRTFSNVFGIFDEMQNATLGQLKMVLTRLGWQSTIVITGDPDQSDLLPGVSGLTEIAERLADLDGVSIVRLEDGDIVRHPLVGAMLPRLAKIGAAQ